MIPQYLQDCLNGTTGSYIRPLLWYGGESKKKLIEEIHAVKAAGIHEFILENRGGDWFATDWWWELLGCALETAKQLDMRLWLLDDSHVNTGSANDSLGKPENAKFRPQNLRIEAADFAGPVSAGALMVPAHTDLEQVVSVSAFLRDPATGHSIGEPVVLTDRLTDGLCLLDLPEGLWRVYFVLTADPSLQGLFANYITMLSPESCRHLINEVHEKVYARFAPYFGNTFAGFFSDEPAFGNCDGQYGYDSCDHRMGQLRRIYSWWDTLPELLAQKTGLPRDAVMAKLPALWDDVDGASDLFRVAYMDVITELWRANFSRQIGRWCEERGVQYIGHVLEDQGCHFHTGWGCGHFFRSMEGQHMAGLDIVLNQMVPGFRTIKHATNSSSKEYDSVFYHYTLAKLGASLAHLTPHMQNRAICEVFGAYGWTCGLPVMRAIFNHFLSNGTNHFIPHAYSMHLPGTVRESCDEGTQAPPGYCMTHLAPTFYFGGLNPQYRQFGALMQYVQRVSHLISSGVHLADVALFYAAEADWAGCPIRGMDDVAMTLSRAGIDFDFVPSDALYDNSAVKDNRLLLNQETYGALVVPMSESLPEKLLRRFAELSAQGLPVLFTDKLPSRCEHPAVDISPLLHHFAVAPLEEVPDFIRSSCGQRLQIASTPDLHSLRFYGLAREDGSILYLFHNDGLEPLETFVSLPGGETALLYDPWTNTAYTGDNTPQGLRIKLQPLQLLAAVFQKKTPERFPLFPYEEPVFRELPLRYDIYIREAHEEQFRLLRPQSEPVNLLLEEKLTRTCAEFRYDATFQWDSRPVSWLQIPQAGDCAELWLNGSYCGLSLGPVCRFQIEGKLRKGENTLSIRTADNPAYFDRDMKEAVVYGTKLPLPMHGFYGPIQIG
ncbi:MAG: hypothetical protein GX927_04770 [Lentisphaerae bacterium]|nr:hypothetical protein [Lentisphaerota bacterium]